MSRLDEAITSCLTGISYYESYEQNAIYLFTILTLLLSIAILALVVVNYDSAESYLLQLWFGIHHFIDIGVSVFLTFGK